MGRLARAQVGMADPSVLPEAARASPRRRAGFLAVYAFLLAAIPAVGLLPIFPPSTSSTSSAIRSATSPISTTIGICRC